MPESYFDLTRDEQAALISAHASTLNLQSFVLEKDIWVCWVLDKLFSMPNRLQMAFKGGTSLSKVYNAIERFSEDIDVTIDYRDFTEATTGQESRAELSRISDKLKAALLSYIRGTIKPYFETKLTEEFDGLSWSVELDNGGEKLLIHYPSAFKDNYMDSAVLLEFGGRNVTAPHELHLVRPYIAKTAIDIAFPEASVTVLALMRTYWEKATLAHVECHRPKPRTSAERYSRHWYDLYQLSFDVTNLCSKESQDLLLDVISHKKEFFHYGYANYDACATGGMRLVPQNEHRKVLMDDYEAMTKAQMFYGVPPSFEAILDRLLEVETLINSKNRAAEATAKLSGS